jgi:hypothetical protein
MTSTLFSLNTRDFVKGLLVAIFTPVVLYVGQILQAASTGGTFSPDWHVMVSVGVSAGIGYLTKNVITNSQGAILTAEPVTPVVPVPPTPTP